jgi:hypothetical protein
VEMGEVIERIRATEPARVDEAHEDVANASAIPGFVKQRVLQSVLNRGPHGVRSPIDLLTGMFK